MRNAARTHEALPEQPTRNTSHEAENGIESNPRSVGPSAQKFFDLRCGPRFEQSGKLTPSQSSQTHKEAQTAPGYQW